MVANMTGIRVATLLLSLLSGAAWGQVLPDPTRPPMEMGDGSSVAVQFPAPVAKGLLSVIISPSRCAAIIDGKTIKLGEKHDGAQLVEITARGVVLQGANGRRTMELFPGVGVKATAPDASPRQAVSCVLEYQKNIVKKSTRKVGLKEKK